MTRIIDEALLASVRLRPCELCGRPPPSQAAHVWGKGFGGWCRYDVAVNLLGLCLWCHTAHHNGKIDRSALLAVVARREGRTVRSIEKEIFALRRK